MVHTLQVTLTGSAQKITANNVVAYSLNFQNNAAAVMRVGDSTVTASKGHSLAASGGNWDVPLMAPTQLSSFYVIGTSTQLLDVTYDDGGL
jgi:hypothetical protein